MTNNDIRKRYTFRIPEELYQMAKAKADRLGISMNALLLRSEERRVGKECT